MSARDPLLEILGELRALAQRIDAIEARLAPRAPDAQVVALVREMRRYVKDKLFTSRELIAFAADPDVKAEPLRDAISALTNGALNSRKIGRLLRRIEGVPVDGACVSKVGEDGGGAIWGLKPSNTPPRVPR